MVSQSADVSGYEISLTPGNNYGTNININNSGGTVSQTTVYVRLKSNANNGSSGTVSLTSSGAQTQNVSTGTAIVNTPPNAGLISGNTSLNIGSIVTMSTDGDAGGTWSSANPSVATIDPSTGVVTAVGIGNAIITYTKSASPCADASATRTLNVTNTFITSGVNSNWSNTSAWGGGVVPFTAGDVVKY